MMSILEYAQDVNKSSEEIMKLCQKLDIKYDDEWMKHRFCEWRFLDAYSN